MKKTLVAIAAAAAVTGAFAEVTISGNIDQAITNIKSSQAGNDYSNSTGLMAVSTPSWITFAGSEDLGNGLKASFKLENGLGINGANLLAANAATAGTNSNWNNVSSSNREAWVGLSGDMGNLQVGFQYAPLFNTAVGTDPNGANNVAGWSPFSVIFGNGGGQNLNAVTYTSPNMNGFSAQIQQVYGTNDTDNMAGTAVNAGDAIGWSINYSSGALTAGYAEHQAALSGAAGFLHGPTTVVDTAAAATSTNGALGSDGDKIKTSVAAVTYDVGAAKLTYLYTKASLNDENVRVDTYGVVIPLGATSLNYSYSTGKTKAAAGDVSFNGQQFGAYYSFSKRTTGYLSYNTSKDTTNDDSITSVGLGIRHSF